MTPPITIVERTTRVGVLGHLDELERLMWEYLRELDSGLNDVLGRQLFLSGFLVWLRQRQRQSVAGATTEICQCEIYQTCDICRGTDRDFSERARELNEQR